MRAAAVLTIVALLASPGFAQADGSAPPPARTWFPFSEAKERAAAETRLILALTAFDKAVTDRWLLKLGRFATIQEAVGRMVLARREPSEVARRRPREKGRLVLYDPGGEWIAEVPGAFTDEPLAVRSLLKLESETAAFLRAARMRSEGQPIEALIGSAHALLRAELAGPANARFTEAEQLALREGKAELVDAARMGAILSGPEAHRAELLEEFGVGRGSPAVRAAALVHAGNIRQKEGRSADAIRDYRSASLLAPADSDPAGRARAALISLGEEDADPDKAAASLRILPPPTAVLFGRTAFTALAPPDTHHVEFFLDGSRVGSSRLPPYRLLVDLGEVPRSRTLRAVAMDANGRVLDESALVLNNLASDLTVAFVRPRDWTIESEAELELSARVPPGRRLQSIEVFWNDRRLAELTHPPYRTTLRLPSRNEQGVVRALARDSSGMTAEDARLVNGAGEEVRVDAVQVYAMVEDSAGRPIEGLSRKDLRVEEDGRSVDASVSSTRDEPITLCLAVDVSSSMHDIAVEVLESAGRFTKSALKPGDRAAVVLFAEAPILVQPPTSELGNIERSILEAKWGGDTALWDSMLFSLEQLATVRGKRALVVFTDLGDTSSRAGRETVVRRARSLGIPVYIVAAGDTSAAFRSRSATAIGRMPATVTGGVLQWLNLIESQFLATGGGLTQLTGRNVEAVFAKVRDDLRGQYLLSWVSPSRKAPGEARAIRVRSSRKGAAVRTITSWVPQ